MSGLPAADRAAALASPGGRVARALGPGLAPLRPLLRWRYLAVVALTGLGALGYDPENELDWYYVRQGSELLVGTHHASSPLPGGLHLYAQYPELQIGPLAFLVASPVRVLFRGFDAGAAGALMMVLALGLLWACERLARRLLRPDGQVAEDLVRFTVLVGGTILGVAWIPLAIGYGHLDDALALAMAIGALWAVATDRPWWLGVLLGLSVAAKPWGFAFWPLLLAPASWRDRGRATAAAVVVTALAWGPFVIADPATLSAGPARVYVAAASLPHQLLGVPLGDAPGWSRVVQLVAALVLGSLAVARGRWTAAPLVGVATRVLLDPQVVVYYGTGVILCALVWDLTRSRRPLPVWTVITFVGLNGSAMLGNGAGASAVEASLRAAVLVAAIVSVLAPARTLVVPDAPEEDAGAAQVRSGRRTRGGRARS